MRPLFDDRWRGALPDHRDGPVPLLGQGPHRRVLDVARRFAGAEQRGPGPVRRAAGRCRASSSAAAPRARAHERRMLDSLADPLRSSPRRARAAPFPRARNMGFRAARRARRWRLSCSRITWVSVMADLTDPRSGTTSEVYCARSPKLPKPGSAPGTSSFLARPRTSPARHGTFADVRRSLDYVEQMGFDVLYLPPIHPIGATARKGQERGCLARNGRSREPLGHRERRGRSHGDPPRAGHARRLSLPGCRRPDPRHRRGHRLGFPGLSRTTPG